MSYSIAAISNGGGAPEQAYRKMQSAGACPERPLAGTSTQQGFCDNFRNFFGEDCYVEAANGHRWKSW